MEFLVMTLRTVDQGGSISGIEKKWKNLKNSMQDPKSQT
jgi:3-dehydroquinate dehydratase